MTARVNNVYRALGSVYCSQLKLDIDYPFVYTFRYGYNNVNKN